MVIHDHQNRDGMGSTVEVHLLVESLVSLPWKQGGLWMMYLTMDEFNIDVEFM